MSIDRTDELMMAIAVGLDGALKKAFGPQDLGFVLLVFDESEEDGNRTNYVSNCERTAVLAALKEVVTRFELQGEVKGNA